MSSQSRSREGLWLELVRLTSYPSTILNADEHGGQKMAFPGGVPKARQSSQNVLAMINEAREQADAEAIKWYRTFRLDEILAKMLFKKLSERATIVAETVAKEIGIKGKNQKKEGGEESSLGLLTCNLEVQALADVILRHHEQGKTLISESKAESKAVPESQEPAEESKGKGETKYSLDKELAKNIYDLFKNFEHPLLATRGRFIAGRDEIIRVAARCVAAGIGTTPYIPESDFGTTFDTLTNKVAHMHRRELSSPVICHTYFYDLLSTMRRCGAVAAVNEAVSEMEAFAQAMPLANRRNSAPFCAPSFFLATVSTGQPISFSPAFDSPCANVRESIAAIDRYAKYIMDNMEYEGSGRKVLLRKVWVMDEYADVLTNLSDRVTRQILRSDVHAVLTKQLEALEKAGKGEEK